MSDPADLSRIQPPAVPPAEAPDAKTEEEVKEHGKRLTPTDRMVESHGDHLRTLRNDVARLEGEKDELLRQLTHQATALSDEQSRAEAVAVKYAALKSSSGVAGCFSFFGNVLVTMGGIALGVAGASADLGEPLKWWFVVGGAVRAGCGVLVGMASTVSAWWFRPKDG